MDNYTIESELQRATPRSVICRDGFWGAVRPLWVFLLPHTWIALAAPVFLILFSLKTLCPYNVEGSILAHSTHHSKSTLYHRLQFEYSCDGKQFQGSQDVSEDLWTQLADGQPVELNILRLIPQFFPTIKETGTDTATLAFMTVFVVLWSGIMGLIVYGAINPSLKSKWLCTNGKALSGSIKRIHELRRKNGLYYIVHYSYSAVDRSSGRTIEKTFEGKQGLGMKLRSTLGEGENVTILYDPNKPGNSIIYKLGDYRAI